MPYGLQQTAAPEEEPVSLTEALAHAKVESGDDDSLTEGRIKAARAWAEDYTGRAFVEQTWKLTLDCWPCDGVIRLPKSPLVSVSSVKYVNTEGTLTTMSASDYQVGAATEPARVVPAYGECWPSLRDQIEAVQVVYVCGYGDAEDVPEGIKEAIKEMVSLWIKIREPVITSGAVPQQVILMGQALLDPYWVAQYP